MDKHRVPFNMSQLQPMLLFFSKQEGKTLYCSDVSLRFHMAEIMLYPYLKWLYEEKYLKSFSYDFDARILDAQVSTKALDFLNFRKLSCV